LLIALVVVIAAVSTAMTVALGGLSSLTMPTLGAGSGTRAPAGSAGTAPPAAGQASPRALADIPGDYLRWYEQAAQTCPGLSWTILAGIGKVESDHGRSPLPGVAPGTANAAGAGGPMQFLAPTFAAVTATHPIPPGGANPPSLYNPHDAIYAAADYLCDNGARNATNISGALWTYNHSQAYVSRVLAQADRYYQAAVTAPNPTEPSQTNPFTDGAPSPVNTVLSFARAQIGTKYVWGGNGPADGGFDCSGLTTAAYRAAGIDLPRTAQTQYNTGPRLPPGSTAQPGDLVFFGTSPTHVTHVGIATSSTTMIDAPDFGTTVRQDPIQRTLVGITRPAQQAQ
jgi:cell wall-associated NlpC family hydrolase